MPGSSLEEQIGAAAAAYVGQVSARLQTVLGERLHGAWLLGSAVLGDFSPERSDIDVQAIARIRLSVPERKELAAALSHEALPCPARGLEFVLYAREDLDGPRGPAFQLNFNTGRDMERRLSLHADEDPRFWFIVDASIARQHGHALVGPPAAAAFPDLPRPLVVGALREALEWHEGRGASAAETVLSACRTWSWLSDGQWRSKGESARWARTRLSDPAPVDKALLLRDDAAAPPLTKAESQSVLAVARAALDAATWS